MEERFSELAVDRENFKIDTRVVNGDKILHNICVVLEIYNWVFSDGIPVIVVSLRAQLENFEI